MPIQHFQSAFRTIRAICAVAMLIAAQGAAADPMSLPLTTAGTGTLYLPALLDGTVETELLLDTGSGYVSLSQETFNRVRDDAGTKFLRQINGVLANGKTIGVPIFAIAELRLGAHCTLHNVEVAVMPNGSRDILGLNAIRQLQPLTLQLDPPSLTANCQQVAES